MRINKMFGKIVLSTLLAVAAASASAGVASGSHMRLRWELVRNVFTAQAPGGSTKARLILTNLDTQALPKQGWSLYFNWMDGVSTGPLEGHLTLEQVAGNLFRIRPTAGFAAWSLDKR